MGRYRLRSPGQPWYVQAVLGLYEFCASLKLAVILIFSSAVVLAWATFVESKYGLSAVHFGVYGTWWFELLVALLAVNIFCAAAIRYPWQRHQTGFVITHIGLLTLLFGCLVSRLYGIDAQMPIFEDQTNFKAYGDTQHLELVIRDVGPPAPKPAPAPTAPAASTGTPAAPTGTAAADPPAAGSHAIHPDVPEPALKRVRLTTGPFSYSAYAGFKLPWQLDPKRFELPGFPWSLSQRDAGVIYDQDGIRIELLDYEAAVEQIQVPLVRLEMSVPRFPQPGHGGAAELGAERFMPLDLTIRQRSIEWLRPSDREEVGGGHVVFWMAEGDAETAAFLASAPEGALGAKGQLVLFVDGQRHVLRVDEHPTGQRFPLGKGGLEAEVVRWEPIGVPRRPASGEGLELFDTPDTEQPSNPAVEVKLYRAGKPDVRVVAFADLPELRFCEPADPAVHAAYWFDYGDKSSRELLAGEGASRIDVIQGHDLKFYYRYWNRKQVVALGPLPTDGTKVDAFKMPIAQLRMFVSEARPSPRPDWEFRRVPFDKQTNPRDLDRAAQIKLTVDGQSETFWVVGPRFDPLDSPPFGLQERTVRGPRREVTVRLRLDELHLGENVRLVEFERKLDPGTNQASHFGSRVFFERPGHGPTTDEPYHISMNAPVDVLDSATNRKYRFFQEAYRGPFLPDDPSFAEVYRHVWGPNETGPKYMTILTLNYDPGRWIKYLGCLLVTLGIATMFYMRAYFFKKPVAKSPPQVSPRAEPVPARGREPVGI